LFVFDVLRVERHDTMCLPYRERRTILDALELPTVARVLDSYDDGPCLFEAVCRSGFEGVVAKRLSDPYRSGRRRTRRRHECAPDLQPGDSRRRVRRLTSRGGYLR
jgi:bifunctional non-homologous end joining protein LigD